MTSAFQGQPLQPHEIWSAWNSDPLLITGIILTVWLYHRGRLRDSRTVNVRRSRCFAGALVVTAVALLSPLDALSGELASAHMVQHLLLVLVAAPLLALSAPWVTVLRGTPQPLRRGAGRWRLRLRLTRGNTRHLRHPGAVWLLHVGTLWFWHASVPYNAALKHEFVHVVEHLSFLLTALMFWSMIVNVGRVGGPSPGLGILLVFTMAMHGVFLSALLTFARTPWYAGYATTTSRWQLTPLADQQLAGVIMWIPGGVVYLAAALALLVTWIRQSEPAETTVPAPPPVRQRASVN